MSMFFGRMPSASDSRMLGGGSGRMHSGQHKERVKARQQRRLQLQPPPNSHKDESKTKNVTTAPITSVFTVTRSTHDQKMRAEILTKRRLDKNDRRSHTGKGRGMPKKGGAGGKGTWGKPGTLDDLGGPFSVDDKDPNYDSETEDKNVKMYGMDVFLTQGEAETAIRSLVHDFFDHADTDDVADSACDLKITGDLFYLFAKVAVIVGFDTNDDSNRELVSVLLSDLYGYSVLQSRDIEDAFEELLYDMDDIILDCPEAPVLMGKFMARCVADDCLAPKFIESRLVDVPDEQPFSSLAKKALNEAHGLINMHHGLVVLDGIWNSGDYRKPVKYLTRKIKTLLKEYQDSLDYANFVQSLHELGIPHFHHTIVYEMILQILEQNSGCSVSKGIDGCDIAMKRNQNVENYLQLLNQLTTSGVVTLDQFEKGLQHVYEEIVDLAIDIPGTFRSLESLSCRFVKEFKIMANSLHSLLKTGASDALKVADLEYLVQESAVVATDA